MSDADDLLYRIAISMLPGMDTKVCDRVEKLFGTYENFLGCTEVEIKSMGGFPRGLQSTQVRHEALTRAQNEITFINKSPINVLWYTDRDYPRNLLKADHAPALIYTSGNTDLNASHIIGIVGTRSCGRLT